MDGLGVCPREGVLASGRVAREGGGDANEDEWVRDAGGGGKYEEDGGGGTRGGGGSMKAERGLSDGEGLEDIVTDWKRPGDFGLVLPLLPALAKGAVDILGAPNIESVPCPNPVNCGVGRVIAFGVLDLATGVVDLPNIESNSLPYWALV